jgi:RES domain-containing protein
MIVWRIANKNYADLSGHNGLYFPGRWHSKGKPIVYFADHPALAMLEVLVNMDIEEEFLTEYVMLKIEIPDSINVEKINTDPFDEFNCQKLGNEWLKNEKTSVCRVRSILSPESYNYLFNPLHFKAQKTKILKAAPFIFDARLFG